MATIDVTRYLVIDWSDEAIAAIDQYRKSELDKALAPLMAEKTFFWRELHFRRRTRAEALELYKGMQYGFPHYYTVYAYSDARKKLMQLRTLAEATYGLVSISDDEYKLLTREYETS